MQFSIEAAEVASAALVVTWQTLRHVASQVHQHHVTRVAGAGPDVVGWAGAAVTTVLVARLAAVAGVRVLALWTLGHTVRPVAVVTTSVTVGRKL